VERGELSYVRYKWHSEKCLDLLLCNVAEKKEEQDEDECRRAYEHCYSWGGVG
jgi:hypothetical protein